MKKILKDPDTFFNLAVILLVIGFALVYYGLVVVGSVTMVLGFFTVVAAVVISDQGK